MKRRASKERVMVEKVLAVTVKVRRENGRVENVQVGTAYRVGKGYRIQFGDLSIGDAGVARGLSAETDRVELEKQPLNEPASAPNAHASSSTIRGLEFCAERARKNLANPAKARWHDDERALLEEIEAELARQKAAVTRTESREEPRGAA
jgi:hypothetical protein